MRSPKRQSRGGAALDRSDARGGARTIAAAGACAVFLLAIVGAATAAASAQQHSKEKPYALIFGTVFSADGRVAYGVPVKVRRAAEKKTLMEGMSDHSGEFAFRVPPGPADYIVWADLKPPKKEKKKKDDTKTATPAAATALPSPAPGAIPSTGAASEPRPGSPATAAPRTQAKVHFDGDERVDIGLHLDQ